MYLHIHAGKYYIISVLVILLEHIFGSYPAVLAPTGVPAKNCGAVTMHSAADLPISDRYHGLQHYLDISSHPKEIRIRNSMEDVDAVILDEAS